MGSSRDPAPLPDRDQIMDFFRTQKGPAGKREISRSFGLGGHDGKYITALLRELEEAGLLTRERNRRYVLSDALPPVLVADMIGLDEDGVPLLRPIKAEHAAAAPEIRLAQDRHHGAAPGAGDRLLVRVSERRDGYWARIIRKLERRPGNIFGVFRSQRDGGRIEPVSRKHRGEYLVATENMGGAQDGDVVSCETLEGRVFGLPTARVTERIGRLDNPRTIGDLVLAVNDIPVAFPKDALAAAKAAKPAPIAERADLRGIDLVTIDDEDARDFDDAVWASPLEEESGGWRILVAIADVSWYVRPGEPLDAAARERGNSVYLPDRVVPMLPEELSNGLCSLVPGEDRPCLAVEIDIASNGKKLRHKFMRGMMRSAARLTYRQVQSARDNAAEAELPIGQTRLDALYGAYETLLAARKGRGAIDLDMPERRILLDDHGGPETIIKRNRFDSHRLIEEFMILANICAAESLQESGWPCMFRIHEDPAADRVMALRDFLKTLNLRLAGGQAVRPRHFAQLIDKLGDRRDARGIQEAVLRTQSQAVYSPENIGHFGLALRDYAHFTSPIRRYSDLLVHRSLIGAFKLGDDGMKRDTEEDFADMGKHLSVTERRASAAERDAFDRYAAAFLSDREGERMGARVTGVERFGLFVELEATGADALLPISALGDDRFRFDENARALVGMRSKERFSLGDQLAIDIQSVDLQTGSIAVSLPGRSPAGGNRRKPVRNQGRIRRKGRRRR